MPAARRATSRSTSASTASRSGCTPRSSRFGGTSFDVIARLRESGTFFALNHLLHFYREQVPLETLPAAALGGAGARDQERRDARGPQPVRWSVWAGSGGGDAPPMACVAGSDAHTLRRVGRTWTEAPGTTAAEFLASLSAGLGRPGGRHGGTATVAGDTYGVIGRYMASVYGWGPRDHAGWHRAVCALLIAALVPVQFLPAVVAAVGKSRERRAVAAAIETARRPAADIRLVARGCRGAAAMTPRRVAITGIGMVTALGLTREENWTNLAQRHVRHGRRDRVSDRGLSQPDRGGGAVRSPQAAPHAAAAAPVVPQRSVRHRRRHGSGRRQRPDVEWLRSVAHRRPARRLHRGPAAHGAVSRDDGVEGHRARAAVRRLESLSEHAGGHHRRRTSDSKGCAPAS